jgi:Raf kinase inhibitor-like YbhB/YbcL family protein
MKAWSLAALIFFTTACDGCKSSSPPPSAAPGVALGSLTVTSKSFRSNGAIPVDYTCDGADRSPELTWSAPPAGTQSFVIIADDSDAPGGTFTHWLAYGLRGELRAIPEGADVQTLGGAVGTNDFNRQSYSGPCPPRGEMHRYSFRVFALNAAIDTASGATRDATNGAMSGHVLAEGALMGVFSH